MRCTTPTPAASERAGITWLDPDAEFSAVRRWDVVVEAAAVVRVVAALQLAEPVPGRAPVCAGNELAAVGQLA